MSYKFDSLIIILNKLDSAESVTVNSLRNDLEVSERGLLTDISSCFSHEEIIITNPVEVFSIIPFGLGG